MFKDLQAFLVIGVDSLVKKSSQKEVRWLEVWGSWWPKAKSGIAITEEVVQESCRFICSYVSFLMLLQASVRFIQMQPFEIF
jgi:hypothetical protein